MFNTFLAEQDKFNNSHIRAALAYGGRGIVDISGSSGVYIGFYRGGFAVQISPGLLR